MTRPEIPTIVTRVARLALAMASLAAVPAMAGPARSASPEAEVRAGFLRFVDAQNAHDLKALKGMLLDSANFLWITRGDAVWGREDALRRFEALYAGTWQLAPDTIAFRVVVSRPGVAQVFAPVDYTVGAKGEAATTSRLYLNQVWVDDGGWKVASILPIPLTPAVAAPVASAPGVGLPSPPAPSAKK
jgi:ketosteroid isomerase-like protein